MKRKRFDTSVGKSRRLVGTPTYPLTPPQRPPAPPLRNEKDDSIPIVQLIAMISFFGWVVYKLLFN